MAISSRGKPRVTSNPPASYTARRLKSISEPDSLQEGGLEPAVPIAEIRIIAAAMELTCAFAPDSPLEESGFEPSVPPCERVGLSGRDANASQATRMVSNASSAQMPLLISYYFMQ